MRAALLVAVCLTFAPIVRGADNQRDGNWWNTLSHPTKVAYALGFLDGNSYAEVKFQGPLLYGMADPKTGQPDRARANVAMTISKLEDDQAKELNNVTSGQLADGLDHIYADYRNMRIHALDALIVVIRSINGMSDAEVEKMLEGKRSGATAAFK
jgi:hypothetical protein